MKYLGQLFGAKLLLDTNDPWVFKQAERVLKNAFEKAYPIKTDQELEQEVDLLMKKGEYGKKN